MNEVKVRVQNQALEFVQSASPLAYTADPSLAMSFATMDLASGLDACMREFETKAIPAFKTVVSNASSPLLDWTIYLLLDDVPYYRIHICKSGTCVMGSVNSSAAPNPDMVALCTECRAMVYDYLLDIFGPSMLSSSISSVVSAASAAMGGSSASFKKTDDIDAIIEKIQQETKAEVVKPKENLSDYVCDDSLREQLMQIVDFFNNRKAYSDAGIELPKGVLFKGPPGTGKTYAARCIAGTVDCYFMTCTASSLQGMYIGSGASNIKAVFKGARMLAEKSKKGVILFIDELDSVGTRGDTSGAGDEVNRTINQLLAEMSGFGDDDAIMVMGATNFEESIDPALMRSGRFSRQITIDYPDDFQREQMLTHYASKLKIKTTWDPADATPLTKTFTPADIKEAVNGAAIKAVRTGGSSISLSDLNESINEVITKDVRKPDNPKTLDLVTAHECGHVLAEVLMKGTIPTKVTNYAYGDAGGFTQPSEVLTGIVKAEDLINEVYMLVAGRAAEQVELGYVTTGASNDIEKAKRILRSYYVKYAFESYDTEKLDQLILDRLNECYTTMLDNLRTYKDTLDALIGELRKSRVLYASDIAGITAKLILKGPKP